MALCNRITHWLILGICLNNLVIVTIAHPQQFKTQQIRFAPSADRKFAEKPNALKKVALDDIDEDIQTNQISDNGFSWSNMLGGI